MIFYEKETIIGLAISSLPAILGIYFFFIRDKEKIALPLLFLSAFLLRFLMISLDPFLHDWDERFHALVAKNMMDYPFKPMLIVRHITDYNYHDWGYNHIWVHKQPLFLWQMALSMKVFGINTIALRLPSAIMGTILVWLTYDISLKWVVDKKVAFLSSLLVAFAGYALGLTSGWIDLEHNDMAFVFYLTCSIWAFTKYVHSDFKLQWALCVGLFAGLAILNKWLVGLLIFGGWSLYLLLSIDKSEWKKYIHLGYALMVCAIVFIPWQLYILNAFPLESSLAFESNRKHLTENLGHPGDVFFHFNFLGTAYHWVLVLFLLPGLISSFTSKRINSKITISFVAMIVVIFSFFSFLVATKMPTFVYPVSSLLFILMALGMVRIATFLFDYLKLLPKHRNQILFILAIVASYYSLKPQKIVKFRNEDNQYRNNKIHNASAFKQMDDNVLKDYIIQNCRSYENIELMFYKNCTAYHFYPPAHTLDSLQNAGYKFAAFQYLNDPQQLPEYITNDKEILILSENLK